MVLYYSRKAFSKVQTINQSVHYMPGEWLVPVLRARHVKYNSIDCSRILFEKWKQYKNEEKHTSKIKATFLQTKPRLVHVLFELLTVLQGRGWPRCSRHDTSLFPPCLVPLALQIARPVYLNEVDKDVQNSIVCSLCSAPEETQSTSLSVLADVAYILWFHLGYYNPPPTDRKHTCPFWKTPGFNYPSSVGMVSMKNPAVTSATFPALL